VGPTQSDSLPSLIGGVDWHMFSFLPSFWWCIFYLQCLGAVVIFITSSIRNRHHIKFMEKEGYSPNSLYQAEGAKPGNPFVNEVALPICSEVDPIDSTANKSC